VTRRAGAAILPRTARAARSKTSSSSSIGPAQARSDENRKAGPCPPAHRDPFRAAVAVSVIAQHENGRLSGGPPHPFRQHPKNRVSGRKRSFAVDPDDLLLDRMRAAAENPCLRRRGIGVDAKQQRSVDSRRLEKAEENVPFRIVPDRADRKRRSSKGSDVGDRVRPSTEHVVLPRVSQDEDWRLSRDPLREAEDEAVENEVARDGDPGSLEAVHELVEPGSDGR
jgi:hypothetical protein